MATKNYTTKTASLRATQADVRTLDTKKLFIDGVNINDLIKNGQVTILDDRGTLANDELDIWRSNVSTDEEGNVIVREYPQKFKISIDDMSETQKSTLKSSVKVENNQVLGADNTHLMFFETNALTNGYQMFSNCRSLTSFNSDLSSLTNGYQMFQGTRLASFNTDLSSLTYGSEMFGYCTALASFSSDLSSLVNGYYMFNSTALASFSSDLSSLTNGLYMFYRTQLASFNTDLSSLTDGSFMFASTPLTSFNGDLSSLTNGSYMFSHTSLESFSGDLSSLSNGQSVFAYSKLTSFSGDLSSLISGYDMFSGAKLDAPSLANIIHTINTPTKKGTITIGLGIDNTKEARQSLAEAIWCSTWDEVNQEFTDKNWTVQWQFNGAPTSAATLDMNTTPSPIWVKLEEVIADENGNLPHYSYVSEDGSKYFNIHWYHSSNGDNEGYDYFGSLLEACGYFGVVPKEYAEQN